MRRSTPLASLLGALFLACSGTLAGAQRASAQEPEAREGYTSISPRSLRRLASDNKVVGKRFSVAYVKFLKVFRGELKLYAGVEKGRLLASPLKGMLTVGGALERALQERKDSQGKAIVPQESNVQLFMTGKAVGGKLKLVVDRVVVLHSTLERFEQQASALPKKDPAKHRALIRRVQSAVRSFPKDAKAVAPLLARLRAEARSILIAGLPALPGGAQERIEVGVRLQDVPLVAEVWAHAEVSPELQAKAQEALEKNLQARLYLGEWYVEEALREKLGFVRDGDRWVRRELVWLREAVEREKGRLRRSEVRQPFTRPMLINNVREGRVLRGMEKELVIAALKQKHGETRYPVLVLRTLEKKKTTRAADLEWEIWVMPSGLQLYFCNGLITEKVAPKGAGEEKGGE